MKYKKYYLSHNTLVKYIFIHKEVKVMSPKELSYIEDALNHEKHMKTKCTDYASKIQDPELKSYVNQLVNNHQQIFGQFYKLL